MKRPTSETFALILIVLTVYLVGTLGYTLIEGWPLIDSFYMTAITLATIGYQEVHPLSNPGRLFTILLIFLGVGTLSIIVTHFGQRILNKQLARDFRLRRVKNQIAALNGHTILCGFGRLTRIAAKELRNAGVPLVVIDRDPGKVQEAEAAGMMALQGDSTLEETLIEAGIRKAKRLVALMPKDSDNLYVVLTSKELNPDMFLLSRAEDEAGEKRLLKAGANRIIAPYRVGGQKIADAVLRPYVTDFIDLAVSSTKGELQIEEIAIPQDSSITGKTLKDSGLRQRTNIMVAAIVSKTGETVFNPSGDTMIQAGATLIGIGFKKDFDELGKILVVGGGTGT